jgi:hypothetical protein
LLYYAPVDTPDKLDQILKDLKIERNVPIVADSSDRYTREGGGTVRMVADLRKRGWLKLRKVSKTKTLPYWIQSINQKTIVVIKTSKERQLLPKHGELELWQVALKELNNYVWAMHGEHNLQTPDDNCAEHYIDGFRYRHMDLHTRPNVKATMS